MKKAIFCGILVLIFVGIGVLAYFRYQEMKQKEKKPRANPVEQSVVVNMVMPGSVTMFDERVFSGSTKAWSSVDIDPKVSGKLITLNFNIGDAIKKGDLIAKIDDVEYVQKVRQAEANLETARAKLAEAKELLSLRQSEFDR